jgi:hypothetical protein
MPFELLHFRGADKILKKKNMDHVVQVTCESVEAFLYGTLRKGGLLRQALEECDWRQDPEGLKILPGRKYTFKGIRNGVAIDGNFASYEAIWDSLLRLQIGWAKKKIDAGLVFVTGERSEKSQLGSTKELIEKEIELLYPTISVPVSIAIFDLGKPGAYLEADAKAETASTTKDLPPREAQSEKRKEASVEEMDKPKDTMLEKLNRSQVPLPEDKKKLRKKVRSKSPSVNQ